MQTKSLIFLLVAIAKELQGKGVGKRMMLDAEKWAKVKGFNQAYVDSGNDDFFKKCGYSHAHKEWFGKKI